MTRITVVKLVDKPKKKVMNFILEISNFEKWWNNFNARYDKHNQIITFSPIPFLKFQLKLFKATENEIQFDYLKTPFKGVGIWNFTEQNNCQTIVSYSISIKGNNFIVNSFIKSKLFRWKHQRDILNLLKKLNHI